MLCRWGIVVTILFPSILAILWFGIIPLGNPLGSRRDRVVFVFLVNPVTQALLSYLLLTLFFSALNASKPYQPLRSYAHILAITYFAQVCISGPLWTTALHPPSAKAFPAPKITP